MSMTNPPPLRLLTFEQIITQPLPSIEWDVERLIALGDRVVVFGEFGSYKSWLLLDLALHLAAGKPWLGQFAVPQARSVLYVDCEMNERTLRRRVKRLAQGAGFDGIGLPFQALSRPCLRFTGSAGTAQFLSLLKTCGFDPHVIIVESLRRVMAGNENNAEDVAAFWAHVEPIPQAGKTLIVSHHMRKPTPNASNRSRDRASGSTDILAGSDASFAVLREPAGGILVESTKARETEQPESFRVRLADEGPDSPARLVFEGFAEDGPFGKHDRAAGLIVAFLAGQLRQTAETGAIHQHTGSHTIPKRTSERALKALEDNGRLRPGDKRGTWQLVEVASAA